MPGKKRARIPDVQELLEKPWCYYCEREFEDLKMLISHQKAKHFKCSRCNKRLNTAGGLAVHMTQVHKETLEMVENTIQGREGLEVEIFGMEGVPAEILHEHQRAIVLEYNAKQMERRIATGNPPPGQGGHGSTKRLKTETPEELKARLAEFKAKNAAAKAAAANGGISAEANAGSPGQAYPYPQTAYPPTTMFPPTYPPSISPPPGAQSAFNLPARPTVSAPIPTVLPARPPYYYNASAPSATASAISDDIDEMIRMAEAGIKPPQQQSPAPEGSTEKKGKKEKHVRMVYGTSDASPEERISTLTAYNFVSVGA
ncbi:RING-6 [Lasiosphaeria ovina]|uniref:RING-6 n=1 Tax=Lasiosphaeria ovina TaxID=92902 RepID=A0AAE0KIL0_9PEZI|nr:RING-6 [Lasiosphaeria ovina]